MTKTPVNSKQHWPRLNTAPSDLYTQWTMGLCNSSVAYVRLWLLSVKLETLLRSKIKFYLNRSSDSLNNNNHMSSNRITPVLIRTYSDLIWNHAELLIFSQPVIITPFAFFKILPRRGIVYVGQTGNSWQISCITMTKNFVCVSPAMFFSD